MPKPAFILLDANGLLYRAYYAVKGLINSKGQATNAVFGFNNILRKVMADLKPAYIAACFDVDKKTHRQAKFTEYKAKRQSMPDDLVTQIPLIHQLVEGYNIPICQLEGYEADDVMATLAYKYAGKDLDVIMVTEDKDMAQMVGGAVHVYSSRQEKIVTVQDIKEKFGVTPDHIVDYLALTGDASDNIPGVPGIGEVGARKLLTQFKSIDDIYDHIDQVDSDKLREKLLAGKESAFMSRELATVHTDIHIPYHLNDFKVQEPDRAKLLSLYQELDFRKLVQEMQGAQTNEQNTEAPSVDELFDDAQPVTVQDHGRDVHVVYDLKKLLKEGHSIKGEVFDVFLAGYLLAGGKDKYDLTTLAWNFLKAKPHAQVLKDLYAPMVKALHDQGMWSLYNEIELPLVYVLVKMEQNGVCIDTNVLDHLSKLCQKKMTALEKDLFKEAGGEFNINSPKQLSEVLFERLKLPVVKKTKTGFSTDEEVLTRLSDQHPLPAMILEYRSITKLKSTYIDALPAMVNPQTGRIHASFNQAGAETGRLSSNNPNLQNIPVRTELGKKIRAAFVPYQKDHLLLSADYSQIELRILAHLADDEGLKMAFAKDQDIHRYTASLMFDVDESKVDDKMRYAAKRINFGIIYGMSAFGLAKDLEVSQREAQEFIDKYFLRYPKVHGYLEGEVAKAKEHGYVQTMFGRRRYLPDINNRNMALRNFAQRQAINAPIQGTAADLIKKAMVSIDEALTQSHLTSTMIMTVHDELVFDVIPAEKEQMIDLVRRKMEHVMKFSVPIRVHVEVGANWLEMDKV